MNQYYIGIDLGGTNVRIIAAKKGKNKILAYRKERFQKSESGEEEFVLNLVYLVQDVVTELEAKGESMKGIGIALAALFDRKTGVITKWPNNQKWNGLELRSRLEEYFHVPVIMEDDANAAAIGEQAAGAGIGYHDLAYITVSTGIGCGIIVNDTILTGCNGWAGELGHIKVTDDKVKCMCGAVGCLQAVASGPGILKEYMERSRSQKQKFGLEQVVQLADKGDPVAIDSFRKAGKYIGNAIANVAMLLDIPLFILGGGVLNAGEVIMKPIEEAVNQSLQQKRSIQLVVTKNSDRNGLYGAVSLIDQFVNKEKTIFFSEGGI